METQPRESVKGEERWPAIPVAYDFVLPSYQWLIARFEAADGRIQSTVTVMSGFTFAVLMVIATVGDGELSYKSNWFYAAAAIFLAAIVGGSLVRALGGVKLPSPGIMYEKHMHRSPEEFKRLRVAYAGQHFATNARAVWWKGWTSAGLTLAFVVELVCLALWAFPQI